MKDSMMLKYAVYQMIGNEICTFNQSKESPTLTFAPI